jgi:hypothetical protein
MILKATKKPVAIECIEWAGENLFDVITFTDKKPELDCMTAMDAWESYESLVKREGLKIHTLEGVMNASVGDFIIKGVNGGLYPCKPDIFHKTYDINS